MNEYYICLNCGKKISNKLIGCSFSLPSLENMATVQEDFICTECYDNKDNGFKELYLEYGLLYSRFYNKKDEIEQIQEDIFDLTKRVRNKSGK